MKSKVWYVALGVSVYEDVAYWKKISRMSVAYQDSVEPLGVYSVWGVENESTLVS